MGSYSCCKPHTGESRSIKELTGILKIVGEENRLNLLCILRKGEHCVCEMMEHTSLSQSLISHHLKDLKESSLVSDNKQGLRVYYSLTDKGRRIADTLLSLQLEEVSSV